MAPLADQQQLLVVKQLGARARVLRPSPFPDMRLAPAYRVKRSNTWPLRRVTLRLPRDDGLVDPVGADAKEPDARGNACGDSFRRAPDKFR